MQYIDWLIERVCELHRILKPIGSMFLHCDWHADACIRVFILDKLFGEENFRAEITWKRSSTHSDGKQGRRALGNITDIIWHYSKTPDNYTLNQIYLPYTKDYIAKYYGQIEPETGR